jgi:hypothetical protein
MKSERSRRSGFHAEVAEGAEKMGKRKRRSIRGGVHGV